VRVEDETANVLAPSLDWNGNRLALGPWQHRTARFSESGLGFVAPAPGSWVSLHWDFVCDRLTLAQAATLYAANERALAASNRSAGPRSALA
jgi:hypothetical protein